MGTITFGSHQPGEPYDKYTYILPTDWFIAVLCTVYALFLLGISIVQRYTYCNVCGCQCRERVHTECGHTMCMSCVLVTAQTYNPSCPICGISSMILQTCVSIRIAKTVLTTLFHAWVLDVLNES